MDAELYNKLVSSGINQSSSTQIGISVLEGKIGMLSFSKVNDKGETITFDLVPWSDGGVRNPFISMAYNENLNSPFMYGVLFIYDYLNWGDEFVLNGTEKITLGCNETLVGQEDKSVCMMYDFRVFNITKVTDDAQLDIKMKKVETSSIWKIEFTSNDILTSNYQQTYLENLEDFVGYIGGTEESPTTPVASTTSTTSEPMKGLVDELFAKFELTPSFIEPTSNGIWLKYNHVSWPWMKHKGQLRLLPLLNYIAQNAVSRENPNAVNYSFWHDRKGWHFESVDKLIRDQKGKVVDGFLVTLDTFNPKRIYQLNIDKQFNITELNESGAINAQYVRVDPNYNDPYLDFIDTNYGLIYSDVTFDYNADYDSWHHVGDKKFLSKTIDSTNKNEVGKVKPSTQQYDDAIYGYMSKQPMNTPFPQWWDNIGNTQSGPWSSVAWQPQYDLSNLKIKEFHKIHNLIRKPLKKKRDEYNRKKNIKRKWETYRCTVCCHQDGALGSTADIEMFNNPGPNTGTTYTMLFGPTGMFAEFNQEYKIVAAGSLTDQLNYDSGVTFLNGLTQSYDLTKSPYNESIGDFFNLKEDVTSYVSGVIDRSINQYQILITHLDGRKTALESFLTNVSSYKTIADGILLSSLIPKTSDHKRPIDLVQGYKYVGDAIPGETILDWPITEYEFGMIPSNSIPNDKGIGIPQFRTASTPRSSQITFRAGEALSSDSPPQFRALPGDPSFSGYICHGCINNQCTPVPCSDPQASGTLQLCLDGGCGSGGGGGGPPDTSTYTSCCYYGEAYNPGGIPCVSNSNYESCVANGGTPMVDCVACNYNNSSGGPQGTPGPPGPRGPTGPTGPTGPSGLPTEEDIVQLDVPTLCSNDPVVRGYIRHINDASVTSYSPIYVYAAPYLWAAQDDVPQDWSFYDYGTNNVLIPGIIDVSIRDTTKACITTGNCYNTTCLSSTALEALARTCIAELQLIDIEMELLTSLRDNVQNTYKQIWIDSYQKWFDRKAFFQSKKPGENVFNNPHTETGLVTKTHLSLENIKKITRKEIRGSRYEILSKSKGITGASAGEWVHSIFFGNDPGSTAHPYYDQKYKEKPFITSRESYNWYSAEDADSTDSPAFQLGSEIRDMGTEYGPEYRGKEHVEVGLLHIPSTDFGNITNVRSNFAGGIATSVTQFAQGDLNPTSASTLKDTFNFYQTGATSTPPNVKKEEITSYIRVEFNTPIGMDRIKEFPDGFVRDAGTEYFLPYIVQLTPGPFGRQSVKYNAAVIGMDPYGFDVAVKKIKDDIPVNRKLSGIDRGNFYSWWNHDTGSVLSKTQYLSNDYNGMDLWPEPIFETQYTYYAYDHSQEDIHGGNRDQDFHNGGAFNFEDPSQDWMESLYHYGMSSGKQFDPLYRSSAVGSSILPNSYRKLKPHRSWWSIFVPRNLFIPIRFANMFKSLRTKARDLYGGKGVFTANPSYWKSWYGTEFQDWITLANKGTIDIENILGDSDLSIFLQDADPNTYISANTENTLPEGIKKYFNDSLMHYLAGSALLYRPTLVTEDVWKYDMSGETEYGLTTPPVDTEYEFFDRNFALQFMVFARGTRSCEELGLKCANPNTPPLISSQGCTASPYCNCPAQDRMPTEAEPTYLELYKLYNDISECKLIEQVLGKDWLGCEWSNPDSSCSCNCPEQGKNFAKYLEYTRTYATFWDTSHKAPLLRQAQVNLLQAQAITITVGGNDNVFIGSLVQVFVNNSPLLEEKFKRVSGKWLVSGIQHHFNSLKNYVMTLSLVRDSIDYDINEFKEPKSIFDPDIYDKY